MAQARTTCPHCQKVFKVKSEVAGKQCACRICKKKFVIVLDSAAEEIVAVTVVPEIPQSPAQQNPPVVPRTADEVVEVVQTSATVPTPTSVQVATEAVTAGDVSPYESFAANLMANKKASLGAGGAEDGYAGVSYVSSTYRDRSASDVGVINAASAQFILRGAALMAFGLLVFCFALIGLQFRGLATVRPAGALLGTLAGLVGAGMMISGLHKRVGAAMFYGGLPALLFLGCGGLSVYWMVNGQWNSNDPFSNAFGRQVSIVGRKPLQSGAPNWNTRKADTASPDPASNSRSGSTPGLNKTDEAKPFTSKPANSNAPQAEDLVKGNIPIKSNEPENRPANSAPQTRPASPTANPFDNVVKIGSGKSQQQETKPLEKKPDTDVVAKQENQSDPEVRVVPYPNHNGPNVIEFGRRQRELERRMKQNGIAGSNAFGQEFLSPGAGAPKGRLQDFLVDAGQKPMLGLDVIGSPFDSRLPFRFLPVFSNQEKSVTLADEGYAVGGLNVYAVGEEILGIQCIFMKLTNGKLVADDKLAGPWIGSRPGESDRVVTLAGDGRLIYGVWLEKRTSVHAIGLIHEPK